MLSSAWKFLIGFFFLSAWSASAAGPSTVATPDPTPKEGTVLEDAVRESNKAASSDLPQAQLLPPLDLSDSLRLVVHRAKVGETLARLFDRFGLPKKEKQTWLRSVRKYRPMKKIPPGRELHFYFVKGDPSLGKQSKKERLKALEIELNDDWSLTWEKGNQGIVFSKREKPYNVQVKRAQGVVGASFGKDSHRTGLQKALFSQLDDIFSGELDSGKLQKGDSFKLLYEERSRGGSKPKLSIRILAAEFLNLGKEYFAIYFKKDDAPGKYYDLDGKSLARSFLRFPLRFTSISSFFSHSRFNPILKVDMPHHGVDFVAKRGTPVRAIGDGKISHAGWQKGGYGRMVEIEHDSTYSSRYAHLQGLAPGIRPGANVRKGQVIGYVGSTGRSTGTHLHFELYKDHHYVDPLNFEPSEDRIEPSLRRIFENSKRLYLAELGSAPRS